MVVLEAVMVKAVQKVAKAMGEMAAEERMVQMRPASGRNHYNQTQERTLYPWR